MRWLKSDRWKAGIGIAGMLLLLVLMVGVPVSAAGAYEVTPGLATPTTGTVQVTPTVDVTVTALSKEQLALQVKQLQNQLQNQNNWLSNNSTALIAAFATVVVALFGIYQWAGNRTDERKKEVEAQEKDLKAQAEERFKTAVTALGDEKEGVQVGGAILLRSFLNKEDKKSYERYYTQVFDLAVAYLRISRTAHPPKGPDVPSSLPEQSDIPQPLTTLSQALIMVFKEAFPPTRDRLLKKQDPKTQFDPRSLDARSIQLDNAYLGGADLNVVYMPQASLRKAHLNYANLSEAYLMEAILSGADLSHANLSHANLSHADLSEAYLMEAILNGAYLMEAILSHANLSLAHLGSANLSEADLSGARLYQADLSHATINYAHLSHANLSEADLSHANLFAADLSYADLSHANLSEAYLGGMNPEDAVSLEGTDLRGAKWLTKEQLEACKAKHAIVDEASTTNSSQSTVPPSLPSPTNDVQSPSTPSAQGKTPTSDTGGSSATPSSKPGTES